MVSSNFRKEAREKLSGKWGKGVCITLAYTIILMILNSIETLFSGAIQALISLAIIIIQVPLVFGLIISFVKLFNQEKIKVFDFFLLGFKNFGRSWRIAFQIFLKLILPILLMVIAIVIMVAGGISQYSIALISDDAAYGSIFFILIGSILLIAASIWNITKSYYYQLAYIIASENPDMSSEEAVEESEKLMNGKRWKLFCLQLSFIGWAILAIFTLGIGYLWLAPYMQFATIAFYKFVSSDNNSTKDSVVKEDKIED